MEKEIMLKKGMIVICPKNLPSKNLKEGQEFKIYKVEKSVSFGFSFWTTDEDGYERFCLLQKCAHLNGGNWIIKTQSL